jgi:hypothetical protein
MFFFMGLFVLRDRISFTSERCIATKYARKRYIIRRLYLINKT